ncbi:hypothetical protein GCM10011386_22250 [Parapedobacter defluvii]|uniref:Uncharacterized protein n=2 Tax=Parapedobacter defluvii TaxID=2045106 RepID=A0ABQ1LUQ5_9SPHI|nr:hypothetical protein [Parapedobacter defluvii]RQP09535.1 MAG: hypothetical protein EAS52_23755 [Parapedobacter sp.]GGC29771.1 hypothetical protein GCM10011386_22250 [Parapedobacter defluvii]
MRTVAELPHPDFKITIFTMNQKFIVKFEQGTLEQVYKIAEADITDGVNGVFQLIDDDFTKSVSQRFDEMRQSFIGAYKRHEY